MQRAVETYDCMEKAGYVGKLREGHEVLAPVSHWVKSADIEITIDDAGTFVTARRMEEEKIIIPVTEDSLGRSGTTAKMKPHPLCDQLKYIAAEENYYIPQLASWAESPCSHPKVRAILRYVEKQSIIQDLTQSGILKRNKKGEIDDYSATICWSVIGMGEQSGPCWMDSSLIQSFISYYAFLQSGQEEALCMISGDIAVTAKQHAKGIVPNYANAKLISSNDTSGFTYRGRFMNEREAETVSYRASQKAHNAMRWIASEQGVRLVYGGRIFLCWNPQGKPLMHAANPIQKFMGKSNKPAVEPSDYWERLKSTLEGLRKESQLTGNETAVIAAFDAATTGRLSLTYYNELRSSDFLDRLRRWDSRCCWWNRQFGIQTPPLWQIVNCAFGTQRTEKGKSVLKTDDRVMKQQMQRLISCRVDSAAMPFDLVKALANRASTPQAYERLVWEEILFTACAAINCYMKEEDCMAWELDRKDRSFQFGRLLAVMDRAERDFYYRTQEDKRETSAMKRMSAFRQHPMHIYEENNRHLYDAYLSRIEVWQKKRYEKLRDEIIGIIMQIAEEDIDKPLKDTYLLGYSRQRQEFFKSKNDQDTEE